MSIQHYVIDLEIEAFIVSECGRIFSGGIHYLAHGLVTVPTMLHCHTTLAPFGVYLSFINFTYFSTNFKIVYFDHAVYLLFLNTNFKTLS